MTDEEFETLVGRLEQQAKRNPAGYRTRVLLMALLGNAYLGVMLVLIALLVVAAAISVVWLKAAGVKIQGAWRCGTPIDFSARRRGDRIGRDAKKLWL
jgi:hypothetical protein